MYTIRTKESLCPEYLTRSEKAFCRAPNEERHSILTNDVCLYTFLTLYGGILQAKILVEHTRSEIFCCLGTAEDIA